MLANKAVQNPDTVKPRTIDETSSIISAFITSRNNPNVSSVSGRVSSMSKGLMIAFAKPSSSAAISNEDGVVNLMPLKI